MLASISYLRSTMPPRRLRDRISGTSVCMHAFSSKTLSEPAVHRVSHPRLCHGPRFASVRNVPGSASPSCRATTPVATHLTEEKYTPPCLPELFVCIPLAAVFRSKFYQRVTVPRPPPPPTPNDATRR